MTEQNERKPRKTVTRDTVKTVRKLLAKEMTLKEIAEEAEISISCAKMICKKIHDDVPDEDIFSTTKGRLGA